LVAEARLARAPLDCNQQRTTDSTWGRLLCSLLLIGTSGRKRHFGDDVLLEDKFINLENAGQAEKYQDCVLPNEFGFELGVRLYQVTRNENTDSPGQ
jgi:hypothetical protein